jgi:DNA-binding phage protein
VNDPLDRLAARLAEQAPERVDQFFDQVLDMPKRPRKRRRAPEPIGNAIKATIRERGLSTYALGKLAGVSPGIISRWLNGERSPSLKTLERLTAALDLVLVPREHHHA